MGRPAGQSSARRPDAPDTVGPGTPPGPTGTPVLPSRGGGQVEATGRPSVTLASYPDYPSAQRVVDHLADNRFPVERCAVIGTNLTLVETVLGRMTTVRAALAGAASGAWLGLFIGLLFGIFTAGNWPAILVVALLVGAAWGAIFGTIAHAMGGGQRDFTSTSSLRAGRYAVIVDADFAEEARQLLDRMDRQAASGLR